MRRLRVVHGNGGDCTKRGESQCLALCEGDTGGEVKVGGNGTQAGHSGPVYLLMPSLNPTLQGREAWWTSTCTGANTSQFQSQPCYSLAE